jgi:hypothetical protein
MDLIALSDILVADGKPRLASAVVICVQDKLHAKLTVDFCRRGFHVLCEKPLGITVQECIKVAEEVAKSGVVYALGHSEYRTHSPCNVYLTMFEPDLVPLFRLSVFTLRRLAHGINPFQRSRQTTSYCPFGTSRLLPLRTLLCEGQLAIRDNIRTARAHQIVSRPRYLLSLVMAPCS